jgi:ferritin-like metal-binding protein YciE
MVAFLRAGDVARRTVESALKGSTAGAPTYELSEVRLLAPLPRPNSMRDCLAFEEHLKQTAGQIERLNQVFEELGERARGKKCEAMESIIDEGQQMIKEAQPGPTRDALLVAAAQKVEHYEIASYGTARTYASQLGHDQAAGLLEQTLREERATDEKLTGIAESYSNPQAAGRGGKGRQSSTELRGRATSDDRNRSSASRSKGMRASGGRRRSR